MSAHVPAADSPKIYDVFAGMCLAQARHMRIVGLLMVGAMASALVACGGATTGTGDGTGAGTGTTAGNGDTTKPPVTTDVPSLGDPPTAPKPGLVGEACASPTSVLVPSGGTIVRPAGSALRLQLVYQGSAIGITTVRGVDMILGPPSGPYTPGEVAAYWVETRSANATTYQHWLVDPTVQEAIGGPNGEGFSNSTIPQCTPKYIQADVPNDGSTTDLVVYGSPYGTNDGAVELARFTVK
jgi:hypothetical protein